jgi:hypothetical protein
LAHNVIAGLIRHFINGATVVVQHDSAFLFFRKKETLAKKKLSGCISHRAAYGCMAVTTHKLAALKQGLPRSPCRLQQLLR